METSKRTKEGGRVIYVQVFNGKEYKLYPGEKYFSRGCKRLHREVWKFYHGNILKGYHVHHKDGDVWNNEIDNLELIEGSEHLRNHAEKHKKNPVFMQEAIKRMDYARIFANKWHGSEEGREWHRKMAKKKPRMSNQRNSYVHGAEKSLNQSQTVLTDSAQINANPHIDCIQELTMKQEFVKNADANLLLTSTIKTNIAADSVLQNIEEATLIGIEIIEESSQRVYDLEIEDEHEYFANGVLVHNCLDAARYWTIGELMGRIKQTRDYSGIFGH